MTTEQDQALAKSGEQEKEVCADQHEQQSNDAPGTLALIERLRNQGYKMKVVGPVRLGPPLSE